jgi:hypothetical protein
VGYVSVDLDPSLGQKVNALRFLHKFPAAKKALGSSDDIRQAVFEAAVKDDPALSSLDYGKDVKPWIGDRFGVAVLPASTAGADPRVIVVLQVTDDGQAQTGLKKLTKGADGGTCSVASGYAVCAETAAVLAAAKADAAKHSLADDPTFTADLKSAGPRGIATAWGNLGKIGSLMPSGQGLAGSLGGVGGVGGVGGLGGGLGGLSGLGGAATTGRVVATLRFDGANLELSGLTRGSGAAGPKARVGTGVEQLPTSTLVAIGASSDPAMIDKRYAQVEKQLKSVDGGASWAQVQHSVHALGFHLPGDLNALFGTKFAIAFGGMGSGQLPQIGIRGDADVAKAGPVLDKASAALRHSGAPFRLHHVPASPGYAVALDQASAQKLAAGGQLGSTAGFKAAVPDASAASVVVYVDLARLLSSNTLSAFGGPDGNPNLTPLSAVGITNRPTSGGGQAFDLRVITR